jgi:hypothetical protein
VVKRFGADKGSTCLIHRHVGRALIVGDLYDTPEIAIASTPKIPYPEVQKPRTSTHIVNIPEHALFDPICPLPSFSF